MIGASGCPRFEDPEAHDPSSSDALPTSGTGDTEASGRCGDFPIAEGFVCVDAGPYIHGCAGDCSARPDWFPTGTAYPIWAPHFAEEDPSLELGAFQIMAHEITVAQYDACVQDQRCPMPECIDSSGSWPPGVGEGDKAVSCLGPSHAEAFCAWQGERHGLPASLPTECQWEKAARGDLDARNYPNGVVPPGCEDARIGLYGNGVPLPCAGDPGPGVVGAFPNDVSPYGAFDMIGNLHEWTRSRMQCGAGDWVSKGAAWTTGFEELIGARVDFRYPGADVGVPIGWDSSWGARCVLGVVPEIADAECPAPMEDQSVCTDPALEALRCEEHHDGTGEGAGVHFDVERTIRVVVESVDGDGLEKFTLQNSVGLPEVQLIGAEGMEFAFPGPVKLHVCSTETGTGGGCAATPDYEVGLASFETPSGNRVELGISCPVE